MDLKRRTIECDCGGPVDVTENPVIAICPKCNRRYSRHTPTLKLLDRESMPNIGVVII